MGTLQNILEGLFFPEDRHRASEMLSVSSRDMPSPPPQCWAGRMVWAGRVAQGPRGSVTDTHHHRLGLE